jgi:redox-sensitive bicupin YhaK (pirin superfamily)
VTRPAVIEVRRAADRYRTKLGWLDSWHSFSFGPHHDPANVGYGSLLVSNDDLVAAGTGFETHPHRDMEIVTWVLSGSLVHQDSAGNAGVIYPGLAQRMSAGAGILHSEKNDSWRLTGAPPHGVPVHFVQMWVLPDERGLEPGYEQREIEAGDLAGRLMPIASGMARYRTQAAIGIGNRDAALLAARLRPGETVVLPSARHVHLFLARGAVAAEGIGHLVAGDAVRITAGGGQRITGAESGEVAEILVWEMD